jgi:hypothetical protein
MWLPIIELIVKGILFVAGAIGVARAFTGQPLVYAAGDASGGGSTSTPAPDRVTSLPPAQAQTIANRENAQRTAENWAANPWLWGAVAVAAFGFTFLVRQTRGLGRDVGSAVKNTRGALKEDLTELKGDPD